MSWWHLIGTPFIAIFFSVIGCFLILFVSIFCGSSWSPQCKILAYEMPWTLIAFVMYAAPIFFGLSIFSLVLFKWLHFRKS